MRVLVVGATGQLGTAVVHSLLAHGHEVRAFVRKGSEGRLPKGVSSTAPGDLRDAPSLQSACVGMDAVIATANSLIPNGSYSFDTVEGRGYADLIHAAKDQNVGRFVLLSVPPTKLDRWAPAFALKHVAEDRLRESGLNYTIVQPSLFMDSWLTLIGSQIPMRRAENATLARPYWFSRFFLSLVGTLVEKRGIALVPGNGRSRHAFITVADVAEILTRSLTHPNARNVTWKVGGPATLEWSQVMEVLSQALGRQVRMINAPEVVFQLQSALLRPFSPAAANILTLNRIVATVDTPFESQQLAKELGFELTTMEAFLAAKVAIGQPLLA